MFALYPGAPALARELILGLIEEGVDVASVSEVVPGSRRGFGHAFGFIIQRLLGARRIPVVPVLLNTYFPPNTPTAARRLEIGAKLAQAIARAPSPSRVAIVASGGLSHFLCEEAFDRGVIEAIPTRELRSLAGIPQRALLSGSSEIRNWLVATGALHAKSMMEVDYIPVYCTAAGSGIGLAFALWQ